MDESDVFLAKDLVHAHRGLSARDAVHAAVMRNHQIEEIMSFDHGLDQVAGIMRLPQEV